ncbi:MAG: leucyl/phenylalanyl-tRNA--protein transferase [Planctomycetota bacterium]
MQSKPRGPFLLDDTVEFPPVHLADEHGLLAVGGDLSVERLLAAYRRGIFPWPWYEHMPMFWWSPDPRFVLEPDELKVPRSLRSVLRREVFEIRCDTAFAEVLEGCSSAPRPGQDGTWISAEIFDGYLALHEAGYAHSIEAWLDGELAGGFYGVAIGDLFCGESMFARVSDASKAAFVTFVQKSGFRLIDCQLETDHLRRFGAHEIPRKEYMARLEECLQAPDRVGCWRDVEM